MALTSQLIETGGKRMCPTRTGDIRDFYDEVPFEGELTERV